MICILLIALLCACTGAIAEETAETPAIEHLASHQTEERPQGALVISKTDSQETHLSVTVYDLYCLDCGKVIQESVRTENTDEPHAWAVVSAQEATCTKEGTEISVCGVCGMEKQSILPITPHQYADESILYGKKVGPVEQDGKTVGAVTSVSTCAKAGRGTLICLQCGGASKSVEFPTGDHEWGEWTPVPMEEKDHCVRELTEERVCAICGETESRVVEPALGHDWGDWTEIPVDEKDRCVRELTKERICNRCGETETEVIESALGHDWGDWTEIPVDEKDRCVRDLTKERVCARCGETETEVTDPALGHDWGEWTEIPVDEKERCVTDLTKERICARCGETETEVIEPAPGHDWSEWTKVPVPEDQICVTEVTEERVCARCGEKETRSAGPAPGHQWEETEKQEPTCTEDGWVVRQCAVCQAEEREELPALGHSFVPVSSLIKQPDGPVEGAGEYAGKVIGTVKTAATCTENGSGELLCVNCQTATQSVIIPKREHEWTEWEQAEVPPEEICVMDVTATRKCQICDEEETEVVIPAPGHQWTAVSYSAPTCTEEGRAVRRCSVCEQEDTIETPALGHYYMWIDSPDGTQSEYVCSMCGDVAETRVKEVTQMYYNNTITSFGPTIRELIGGNVWNRVTPLDLSVEGTFTYPLIASNCYTVGTATVMIDQGIQTVTYKLVSNKITVHSESLIFYPDLEALRTGENAVPLSFGEPILMDEAFGTDQRVIMAITLRADYDAKAPGVQGFREDKELIQALGELID